MPSNKIAIHAGLCNVTYGARCFQIMSYRLNWFEARDSCISQGGKLAEVDNAEINNALKAKVIGKNKLISKFNLTISHLDYISLVYCPCYAYYSF